MKCNVQYWCPTSIELLHVQDTAKDVKKNAGPTADNLADQAKKGGKQAADKAKGTAGQAKKSAHSTLKGAHFSASWQL